MMFCRGRKDVYDLRYSNPKTGKIVTTHSALTAGRKAVILKRRTGSDVRTANLGRTSRSRCLL